MPQHTWRQAARIRRGNAGRRSISGAERPALTQARPLARFKRPSGLAKCIAGQPRHDRRRLLDRRHQRGILF
jgi:hypothetical protein